MRAIAVALVALLCCPACDINARGDGHDGSTPTGADTGGVSPGQDAGAVPGQDVGVVPEQDVGVAPGRDAGATPGVDAGSAASKDAGGTPMPGQFFPPGSVWYQDVSKAALDPKSAAVIADLDSNGGWGNGNIMQIDFSFEVLFDDGSAPMRTFTKTGDFYDPDCDDAAMPVPAGGALEGEDGYECTTDGDCHLLVVQQNTKKLYEMWRAMKIDATTFEGGCLVIWDMNKVYPDNLRGEGCTSADAAGFPITPLLFTADEVKAGAINHAIRFILPNSRIQHYVYVHPSTHSTGPTAGGPNAPPYGIHLRLRGDYPLADLPNEGARVVARAMQKYGMFLADGGQIALTARSDRSTAAKWAGLLGARDLSKLKVTDFEMVDHGSWLTWSGDCVRNP